MMMWTCLNDAKTFAENLLCTYICHFHIIYVKWACLPWSSRQRKDIQQEFRTEQRLHSHQTVDSVLDSDPTALTGLQKQQTDRPTSEYYASSSVTVINPSSNVMCVSMLCVTLWALDITETLNFMPSVSPNHLICPLRVHTHISWEEVKCIALPPRTF